jgi:hypothetical protein
MSSVQERTEAVVAAKKLVTEHCMCAMFGDLGGKFRVIYPEGYYPDGVQVSTEMGRAAALGKLLEVMERHWKASLL